MDANLFTDDPVGWECPACGWAGYVTEAKRTAHRCDGFDLDREVRVFLHRWSWRTEDRGNVEAELRALIAAAKERA